MNINKYTVLAAIGDSNDPKTWSGIPFHFLTEAKKQFQEWLNIIDTMANKNISKINGILDYSELLIK